MDQPRADSIHDKTCRRLLELMSGPENALITPITVSAFDASRRCMFDVRTEQLMPGVGDLRIIFSTEFPSLFRKSIAFDQVLVLGGIMAIDQADVVIEALLVKRILSITYKKSISPHVQPCSSGTLTLNRRLQKPHYDCYLLIPFLWVQVSAGQNEYSI